MAKINLRSIASWLLSLFLAISFVGGGFPKISPSDRMVARFENWGYSADFAILIGVLEMLGGGLVLFPGLAAFGAGFISIVMIGAIYTHLTTGIGSPNFAAGYLALAAILFWLRWRDSYLIRERLPLTPEP